tara:strand:+ start:2248 stop:2754 length:507 start_codon:yes stop_codon:yes gene_type:complete
MFSMENVMSYPRFGSEPLCESLPRKVGKLAQSFNTPQGKKFRLQSNLSRDLVKRVNGLRVDMPNRESGVLRHTEDGIRIKSESMTQGRRLTRENGKIGSSGQSDIDGKAEGSGLAQSLFGPLPGEFHGVWNREQVQDKDSRSGLLKVGAQRGEVVTKSILMEAFVRRI